MSYHSYVQGDAKAIPTDARTPFYARDHLARVGKPGDEVLLLVESTDKLLGFNPPGFRLGNIPAQQPFNLSPQAYDAFKQIRGPSRTLQENYVFVNKSRITELRNQGIITAEQYNSVLLIVHDATGGMYWDELPNQYEGLALYFEGQGHSWDNLQ